MKKYIKPSLTITDMGVKTNVMLSTSDTYASKDGTVLNREEEELFWDEEQGW